MNRLVPELREQELLYSALARSGRYLQVPEAGPFMRELFGTRWATAGVSLPGHLSELVKDLPESACAPALQSIIDKATLFPFHTAFMPEDIRSEVRMGMRGSVTGYYTKLGLAAFKIRPPERLRFCVECLDEMTAGGGDAWWRRDHQLPGIPLCPVHGTVLRLSQVDPGDRNRHSFIAASPAVCRVDADLAIVGVGGTDAERMFQLAGLAAGLLDAPPDAMGHAERGGTYRARLDEVGLMRSRRRVDHPALLAALRHRWGNLPDLIPGLALADDPERSWLAAMVRTGRRAAHPLQHLMLTAVLDGLEAVYVDRPFGTGPWPCRNPVADHHGRKVVVDVRVRRHRGVLYGDFACACGYMYTRSRTPDDAIGKPKFRRFGPLFAPALLSAIDRGDSLRSTARMLELDPKTLMREACMADVEVPWTLKASGAIPQPSARSIPPVPSTTQALRLRRPKRNWFAIDTRLARSARQEALAVAAERPPVRVSFAEVERRISKRDWVLKRRRKLPQTVAAIEAAVEGTDAFRQRRLEWQVARALASGDLRACEVLRAAGLPMSWLPVVRRLVATIQIHGRAAA